MRDRAKTQAPMTGRDVAPAAAVATSRDSGCLFVPLINCERTTILTLGGGMNCYLCLRNGRIAHGAAA